MFPFRRATLIAALLVSAAGVAQAQVRYDLKIDSSFDISGEMVSGSFSLIAPDYVTTNTIFPVGNLLSCEVLSSLGDTASCRDQEFRFDVSAGYGTVAFGVMTPTNPGTSVFYYFDPADFSTPGAHVSQIFGAEQFATMTVTAVPEPATALSLLAGLALLAGLRRRARAEPTATK